ncbi:MAG: hypothetical protein NT160_09360 [Actinobacteria bacterium]|nr:hypothetical protein [Actinomycetota bacterium]
MTHDIVWRGAVLVLAVFALACMLFGTYFLTLDVRAARKGSRGGKRRLNLHWPSRVPRGSERHKEINVEEYNFIDYLRDGEADVLKAFRHGINTLDDIADEYGEGFRPE